MDIYLLLLNAMITRVLEMEEYNSNELRVIKSAAFNKAISLLHHEGYNCFHFGSIRMLSNITNLALLYIRQTSVYLSKNCGMLFPTMSGKCGKVYAFL